MSIGSDTNRILQEFGLNANEVQIYLHLLKAGPQSVQQISRSIGIARSTIYQRVENLSRMELAIEERGEKGQVIAAVDPEKLLEIAKARRRKSELLLNNLEKIVPELGNMYQPTAGPSKILHFEGAKGIRRMIMNYEMEAEDKQLCGYATDLMVNVLSRDFILNKYHRKFLRKGYRDKFIISDAKENRNYIKTYKNLEVYKQGRIEVRMINHRIFNPNVSVSIFDDKYALSLMKEGKPFGVIIQSEEVAQHQKELFKIVWERAEPI